jgi:hypothetical protein
MATTIVTKSGSGAPTASDLVAGELAVDLTNGRLYTEDSGGTVLELGLNPSGNVDVTGSVTADGLTAVNATDTQGKFSGWAVTGANSSSGAIELGQNAAYQGIMSYAADGNTRFLFDNTYGSTGSTFEFRTNTAATAKTHLKILGSGDINLGYEDTGTTPKLFWDASAESLGIGTSSVATKLHVMGNSTVRNSLVSTLTLDAGISASNPYTNFGTGIDFKGRDYSNAIRNYGGIYSIMIGNTSSTTPAGDAGFNSALTFYTNTGGASGTNPTEKMRIDSSGTLLVGRTGSSGLGKLNVEGGADFTGGDVYLCRDSGNVSIGGTTGERLTVTAPNPTDGLVASLRNSGTSGLTGTKLWFNQNTVDNWNIGQPAGVNAFVFCNSTGSSAERMRIDSSGNLLVGDTSTVPFDGTTGVLIGGARTSLAFATTGHTNKMLYSVNSGTAGLHFYDSTNNRTDMIWDNSGNLLVGVTSITDATARSYGNAFSGTSSNPNWKSWGSGSHTHAQFRNGTSAVGSITSTSSATAYNTSSDQRLKENIVDAPSASDDIDAIQVRSFDWKADGSHQKYGMVAQELVTVAPEAVSQPDDPEEMMGVDYSKLVPMMLKEIQSLRARVSELES